MSRRRIGRFLVGALVVVIVAEVGARGLVGASDAVALEWHDHTTQHKVDQMDDRGGIDVAVVGTSMAQQALVPSQLDVGGRSAYNAALNGGVPTVMEPWLLDHVRPRLDPSVVVWGVSPLDLSDAYGQATEDAYDAALRTRPGILASLDRWASGRSELLHHRRDLRDPSSLFGDEAEQSEASAREAAQEVGPDGERLVFETDTSPARARETASRLTPWVVDRDDLAAMVRVAEELAADGVQLVLVELPVPGRFTALYPRGPEQHEIVGTVIDELGAALDVPVVRPDVEFDDADFVDYTHLDRDAAARFSAALSPLLVAALG